MRLRSPRSLRWHLVLLLFLVVMPSVVFSAVRGWQGAAEAPLWIGATLGQIALALAIVRIAERRMAGLAAALAAAARAVRRGETPRVRPLPLRDLDEVARAVEAAGTARHEVERRLRSRSARQSAIVESAADAVVVVDRAQRIVVFNAAAVALFGCPADRALGTHVDRLLSGPLRELVSAELSGAPLLLAGGGHDALTLIRPDGGAVPVEVSISHVDLEDERLCTLTLRDVTERARADEERGQRLEREQAARAQAESAARRAALLAEASHMLAAAVENGQVLVGLARLVVGTVADWCVMDVVDDAGEVARVAVAHADPARAGDAEVLRERHPAAVDDPEGIWRVLRRGEAVLQAEVSERDVERRARGPEHLRTLRALGLRSQMRVPFVARSRTLGVMTLVRATGEPYTSADLAAARELADRIAIALDNAELYRGAQEAHARFATLVEGVDAIVWEAHPDTLEFTFVSQRAEALLGHPLSQWARGSEFLAALVHPDDRETTLRAFRECARTGEGCRLELRVMAADGRVLWLGTIVRAVRDADGDVRRLHGLMVDVTDRKRVEEERDRLLATAEAARAEAEAAALRARVLAEASEALASSLDYDATLERVAHLAVPAFADWCLVHVRDEAGLRVYAACADPAQASLASAVERLVPSLDMSAIAPTLGLIREGEPVLVRDVGREWLEALQVVQQLGPTSVITVPLSARGRPLGSLVFVSTQPERRYGSADVALARDLAHRAAVAVDNARLFGEAERANRSKDEFVATLSHELRTPLTAMLGWVHMLKSGRLAAEQSAAALDSIERNTVLQGRLISDLLDISRIAAGKLTVDKRPVDLRAVVEGAIDTIRREARAKGVTLDWTAAPGGHSVLGDPVRLGQVALNMLTNAVKFTPSGGRVEVRLDRHEAWARLCVADTGEGIDADALPHVFDAFRQADSTSTRRHGGLGLGLAIVRHLVDRHGGRVEARSPGKGRGATFTVHLPVLAVDATPETPVADVDRREVREAATALRLDGVRVLVVDDHEDTRRLVVTVLADRGAEVTTATSAEEALHVLGTTYVDVLVSDIGMPRSDGYELLRRLRAREREHGGRIPAVALTAYAGDEARERAFAAGFEYYVTKPVAPRDLGDMVALAAGRASIA